jgi:hypothetical protein
MRKLTLLALAFALVAGAGSAFAVDRNNNGVIGDEPTYTPGHFEGTTDRDEIVNFPTTGDTWSVASYPYWWHAGDTVYGSHTVALGSVTHADVSLKIDDTVLSDPGYVDLDFRIAGVTVGTLHITAATGTGYALGSFDFAAVAPPFELRYYETNTVGSGLGSIVLNDSGLSTVTFRGGGTPTETGTWGKVKALYR